MSADQTVRWARKMRRNWLVFLSVVLLALSGYFLIKIEERKTLSLPGTDTNQSQS
jgi:hypothetical protein